MDACSLPTSELLPAAPAAARRAHTVERSETTRHPGDVLRVVAGGAALAASGAIANTGRVGIFEGDLFRLVNHLPGWFEVPLISVMQVGAVGAVPVTAAAALAARKPRLARDLLMAGTGAWLLAKVAKDLVVRGRPGVLLPEVIVRHATEAGLGYPSGHAAVAAALATTAGPWLPRRLRHATWLAVVLVAVGRLYVGAHLPADVVGGAALGWIIGAALHLAVGAPTRGTPTAQVAEALEAAGFAPADVTPVDADARGSAPFLMRTRDHRCLFVKAVGREHRNADLLFKLWRYAALRTVEDETPFITPKQQVEHEALLLLLAARAGARVPDALAGLQLGSRPALLVMEHVDATPLDQLDTSLVTPQLLRAVWEQVRLLQAARIAHRDLRPANILIDRKGDPWIVDFGFAELSASDHRLTQDVAELLVSSTFLVGHEQALDAAIDVLGAGSVSDAMPLLQPLALTASTRAAARDHRGSLGALRVAATARTQTDDAELERLARVRPVTLVWLACALFAVHLLLPQVGELHQTIRAVGHAQVPWLMAALVMSAGTYLAAAVAQLGTIVPSLPLRRTFAVQLAASFANRVTPASLGGIGVSIRYLVRTGLSRADAVGASAANTLAGVIVHVTMLVVMGVLVGRSDIGSVQLPNRWVALVVVAAALAVAGFALGTASGRRRVVAPAGRSVRALARVLHHPRRAIELFGGSFAITALYIAALFCSLHAFGADVAWAKVALVYLGGSAVAAASPTPGGLGAIEAALVAGLTALGADPAPSIAGVLAFRLSTFWLPIVPGWISFHRLHKRGVL